MLEMLFGYMTTQCLYVVTKLKIADFVKNQEKSIEDIALFANCKTEALYRIMRCLTAQGIFEEKPNQFFAINAKANLLLSNNPNGISNFILICGEVLYQAAGNLLHTIESGIPAFNYFFQQDFWNYLNENPNMATVFNNAMQSSFCITTDEILQAFDFSLAKKIVDIGGGKGHLLCAILKINPTANGIVYDLPYCKETSENYILENQLSDRCIFESGNFFNYVPTNADLYLLRVILHDWDDNKAIQILKMCRNGINSTGKIIIIEKVVMDNNFKLSTLLGDINMLVAMTGKERTLEEYKTLLHVAKFKFERLITTQTAYSLIVATPN